MNTYTYYVAEFYREGDPRPKFAAGETRDEMLAACNAVGIAISTNHCYIVTIANEIKKHWLGSTDHCSICNDHNGIKCFCGEPIIHKSPLFVSV